MKKFIKLTKNPITWIVCAAACIVGVIIWVFRPNTVEDLIDDLKD